MNKFNKYDYFIVFFIAIIAFGQFVQPVKILGLLSIPYVLVEFRKKLYSKNKKIKIFLILFILWNVVSALWSKNISLWQKDFINVVSLAFDFMLLILLSYRATRPLKAICYGWLLLIICTLPMAYIELITGIHFTSQYQDAIYIRGGVLIQRKFAAATLGNYNNYTTLLCISLPFIAGLILMNVKLYLRFIVFVSLISMIIIIILNSSRGGIIALGLQTIVFLRFYVKSHSKSYWNILIFFIVCICFYYYLDSITYQFEQRMLAKGGHFGDESRYTLLMYGLLIFLDNLLGIGVGNMPSEYMKYPTNGLLIPHNLFMEFLLYGGVFFFTIFLIWAVKVYLRGLSSSSKVIRFIFCANGISLIPISVINSGYFLIAYIWFMIASLYIISNLKINDN